MTFEEASDLLRAEIVDILHLRATEFIGLESKLFDLGFSSLSIVVLVSRLEQKHGLKLGTGDFFRNPTVGGIAKLIVLRESNDA